MAVSKVSKSLSIDVEAAIDTATGDGGILFSVACLFIGVL
jgi:hypothetical protein